MSNLPTNITATQAIVGTNLNSTNAVANNFNPVSEPLTGLTTSSQILIGIAPIGAVTGTLDLVGDYWVSILHGTTARANIKFTLGITTQSITASSYPLEVKEVFDSTGVLTTSNLLTSYSFYGYLRNSGSNQYIAVTMAMSNGLYNSSSSLSFYCNSMAQSLPSDNPLVTQYLGQLIANLTTPYPSTSNFTIVNNVATFDSVTASALSTNLAAFNAASAGTAIPITQAEYNNCAAISGTNYSGVSNANMTESALDGGDSGNANDTTPAAIGGATPFAFSLLVYGSTTHNNLRTIVGKNDLVTPLKAIHTNVVSAANGSGSPAMFYYVVKTPFFVVPDNTGYRPGIYDNVTGGSWCVNNSSTGNAAYYNGAPNFYSSPYATWDATRGSFGSYTIQILSR